MCKNRETCSNCPWNENNPVHHNWKNYVGNQVASGDIKTVVHRCIDDEDTWGETNDENVCLGSQLYSHQVVIKKKSFIQRIPMFIKIYMFILFITVVYLLLIK